MWTLSRRSGEGPTGTPSTVMRLGRIPVSPLSGESKCPDCGQLMWRSQRIVLREIGNRDRYAHAYCDKIKPPTPEEIASRDRRVVREGSRRAN